MKLKKILGKAAKVLGVVGLLGGGGAIGGLLGGKAGALGAKLFGDGLLSGGLAAGGKKGIFGGASGLMQLMGGGKGGSEVPSPMNEYQGTLDPAALGDQGFMAQYRRMRGRV